MALRVLGISTSPRQGGNSDLLLLQALAGAASAGATVEYLRLSDFNIHPCTECNCCYQTGVCVIKDDYQSVFDKIQSSDRLIIATPVFFMTVCAQAKVLIDRAQSLWALRNVLKKSPPFAVRDRRAMVIVVGGSRSKRQFESIRLTMQAYFDVMSFHYMLNLFVNQIDSFGAVTKHISALSEAFRLGTQLVSSDSPTCEKPINVELFQRRTL